MVKDKDTRMKMINRINQNLLQNILNTRSGDIQGVPKKIGISDKMPITGLGSGLGIKVG